jgi:hypothetical protein
MKHNNRRFVNDIIKPLQQAGFVCETRGKNRNKFYISKGKNTPFYTVHSGDSYYPIRGWLKDTYNYEFRIQK